MSAEDDELQGPRAVAPRPKGLLSRIGDVEKQLEEILGILRGMWSDTRGKAELPTSDPRRRFHDQITAAGKAAGTAKAILLHHLKLMRECDRVTDETRAIAAKERDFVRRRDEWRERARAIADKQRSDELLGKLPERRLSK